MNDRVKEELLADAYGNYSAAVSGKVEIGGVGLVPIEYRGVRVLTLSMMDRVHQRPDGTARRNLNEHRARLIEGEDFFDLTADEIRTQSLGDAFPPRTPKGTILTETGYSMLVKSFTDDLAWDVQRQLVKSYFAKPKAPAAEGLMLALRLTPMAIRAARAFGLDKNAAAISANQLVRKHTGQNLLLEFGSVHLVAENQETQWFTPTELSERSGLNAAKMNQLLAAAGFQIKSGKVWELLDAGRPFARLFDTGKKHSTGVPVQQIKWSPAVIEAARKASAGAQMEIGG